MITLSGNNILQMPEVKEFSFTFDSLFVKTTGVSSINFVNSSDVTGLSFLFSGQNTYIKSSGVNKKIFSYNLNESINLSGTCLNSSGNYNYLDFNINDIRINSWRELIPNDINLIKINVANNDSMSFNLSLNSYPINYSFVLPNQYAAFGSTTGIITTNSNFWILNSNTIFSQSYQPLLSFDSVIAPVKVNTPLSLILNDLDDSSQDYSVKMTSFISSNIGDIVLDNTINRTGNNNVNSLTFKNLSTESNISGLFDGEWVGNHFVYSDAPELRVLNYEYSNMDVNGNYDTNQTILIKYEPNSPLSGQSYKSEYITGFNLTSSGQYSSKPSVIFNNYYYITGISQAYSSLLFSSGCTGNLPVIFSGNGGSGASGFLQLGRVVLANLYVSGNAVYNIVTGGSFNNYGTNYSSSPTGIVLTGIYGSQCYDVPSFYGSSLYSFLPFNNTGLLLPQATALTGLVLGTTGLIGLDTGYFVTGLDITNVGYGYNASRMPLCTFIRPSGDIYTINASGNLLIKDTGSYDMGKTWTIYTGWTNNDLYPLESGFSGVLTTQNRFFTIKLECSGLDNTSGVINKLSILPSLGSGITQYITGTKYFSSDPYFLKKKLNSELGIIQSGDLNFFISQTDLDTIYSNYSNTASFSFGDLNF